MKHSIFFILTLAILGIMFPVLSNLRTEASQAEVSDVETSVIAEVEKSEASEPFYDVDKVNPETSVDDGNTFAELTAEEPVKSEPIYVAPAATTEPEPVYIAPEPVKPATVADHIEVAGNWINVYDVDSTTLDAGNSVYRFINTAKGYDGRFYYGHNSGNVFGGLKNLGVGSTFTITRNNITTTYRVSNIVIFEKNQETGKLNLNGTGSYMNNVARAKHNGVQYDISLMTCHGTALGHGDATHRLVIFANAI